MTMFSKAPKKQGQPKTDGADSPKTKHYFVLIGILTLIILLLSGLYLHFIWEQYVEVASNEVVNLAQSLESLFHPEHIAALSGSIDDLDKPEYIMAKNSLIRLVQANNSIRFAYFLVERDGQLVFLFDSDPHDSPDHVLPGQIYEEADDTFYQPFRTGQTVLTKQVTDRWGTWVSALVPVKNPADGSVLCVFGIDIPASDWLAGPYSQIILDVSIVICVLILCFAFIHIRIQNSILKRLNKRISYNETLYRSIFSQAPIGIAIVNDMHFVPRSEYGYESINPMFEKFLGRTSSELECITWPEITHPDDLQADLELAEQLKNGEISSYSMEKRYLRPDGSSVWTNIKVTPLSGLPNGNQNLNLCLLEDISARKKTAEALVESERSKSVLNSHLPGLAYRCKNDDAWTMQFVSAGCFDLTGYPPESLLYNRDRSFESIIAPEYHLFLRNKWKEVLAKRSPFRAEYEIITANNEKKWVLELGQGIFNDLGEVEALEGIILDISDRKKIENDLRYINEHDSLTGLYNGHFLENLLNKDAQNPVASKRALINVNLSTVQTLTKTYGFHYTQKLIKNAADVLKQFCSDECMLFYTYWDRFVYYRKSYDDKKQLLEFCAKLSRALESLLQTERIGGGIGILEIWDNEDQDADQLLKKLLIASEKSIQKSDASFVPCFYDRDIELQIVREDEIKRELALIVDDVRDGGLFLQYQPILDLRSNQIYGFEALSRLQSHTLGFVPPLEFIPLAEETKLIIPIGQKIIRQALQFLHQLKQLGYPTISISINVSAIQLLRSDFAEKLFAMVEQMQVSPKNIILELTESVFADNYKEVNRTIIQLRDAGIRVAIDDFGTGYSSLAREQELYVDFLKIDKYFIDKLMHTHPEKVITSDIISMAHRMGHRVIAEGVEDQKQLHYLKKWGCDKVQGYLIDKPLKEEAAIQLLSRYENTLEVLN